MSGGSFYVQARADLEAASAAWESLMAMWSELLDGEAISERVFVDPAGHGSVDAVIDFPSGWESAATELLAQCLKSLWACLDSLVVESVEGFSVLRRLRDPQRPRYFPIADSKQSFDDLLSESVIDGVPIDQFRLIEASQPFHQGGPHESLTAIRDGLSQLLTWEHALSGGALAGAWITPVEPQVHVSSPDNLLSLVISEPGALQTERTVATFRVDNPNAVVSAQAGSYVDFEFNRDPAASNGGGEVFGTRLRGVISVVRTLVGAFEEIAQRVPGTRRLLSDGSSTTTPAWTDTAELPLRWASEDLRAVRESDFGVARLVGGDRLSLIVKTPSGIFERVLPNASPLRHHERRGLAAEAALSHAAASWGLPDFVLLPGVERKGTGVREISDGLLATGVRGVILQSKCRETAPAGVAREQAWVKKRIDDAVGQINGTHRRLLQGPADMRNGRGRSWRLDGREMAWVGVVVIDHPEPPEDFVISAPAAHVPVVVLLRREWEFLFEQLRSTVAVVNYLHRVGTPVDILGQEPERYYELAAADRAADPGAPHPSVEGLGIAYSAPLLPTAPAGSDDAQAHGLYRMMLEDIATSGFASAELPQVIDVLASLDGLYVAGRSDLGRLLLDGIAKARATPTGTTSWQFRTFLTGPENDQVGFGVCSHFGEDTRAAFSAWVQLRHHERLQRVGPSDTARSIGVMLTPRTDGLREWDTTLIAVTGVLDLSSEDLAVYRRLWNTNGV